MATWNFDTVFPAELHGHLNDPVVIDADGTPNKVLAIAAPYTVQLDWRIDGSNVGTLSGTWIATISLEAMGPGPNNFEGQVWTQNLLYQNATTKLPTRWQWHLDANITNPAGVDEGVYKMTVFIMHRDDSGNPDAMAAFSEGPTIAFYTPA